MLTQWHLLRVVPDLKSRVIAYKRSGLKTEPAFARALGLAADPCFALMKMAQRLFAWDLRATLPTIQNSFEA